MPSLKKFNANGEGHNASMNGASTAFTDGYYENEIQVTVTGKSLTIGIEGNDGNWTCFDNFRLSYLGPLDLSSFETALSEALTAAKAITDKMNADVASALADAISSYDRKAYDNEDDYTTAITAVTTAVTNATASVANYAKVKAAIDKANTDASTFDADGKAAFNISAIETAYTNGTITDSDYSTYITNIATALRSAAKAQTSEGADMTLAIVNPGIDGNANGWTIEINGNGGYAGGPMKPSNDAMEFWGAGTLTDQDKGKSFDYYQIITELPAGVYTIGVDMMNSTNGETDANWNGGGKAGLYGKTTTDEVKVLITTDGETFLPYTTDEITVIDGELRIGVKNFESLTGRWFACDNFKLTYVGPVQDLTPYINAYTTAKEAAQTTSAKTDKMATSIRTELDATIAADVDQTSQEALENAKNALIAITAKAEKSIASYAIIEAGTVPDNSLAGWTCTNTNTFHINTWSSEGNSDGSNMKTPFIENWVSKGSFLGAGKVYYKLEALEPGEQYYAQALVRSYNEASADAPNGPDFFINDNVTKLSEEGNTFTYNGMSGIYATLEGFATVGANGTLTLGIDVAEDRNYNWVAFKSVKIQTLEDALAEANAELTSVLTTASYTANGVSELLTTIAQAADPTAAEVTYEKFIGGSEGAAFAAALAAANNVDATSIPAVRTAKANLETATAAYVAAATAYERAAMVIAIVNGVDLTELKALVANPSSTGEAVAAKANSVMSEFATLALASSKANQAGFQTGEYAPYNNKEGMMAFSTATAMGDNPANYTNKELYVTFSYLKTYSWTENTEEVNAFYDGGFSECAEDNESPLDYTPAGWTASDNMRLMLKNAETYPGLADASATSAIMSWSGGITYGETSGYEMPLKANTVYTLKLKAAGWNDETRSGISVSILNDEEGMTLYNLGTPDKDIKAAQTHNTAGMTSYEIVFATSVAGNYVFHIQSGHNMVITDFELKKAASQVLEFADGSVPVYAPGTYPSVKITRDIAKDRWYTAVYPFAVSGVDNIAVLDSYDAAEGALGFATATASVANEPFLMKSNSEKSEIVLSNVEVAAANAISVEKSEAKLIGTYSQTIVTNAEKNYVISNNKIRPAGSTGATINPYRAYIQVDQPGEEARALTFFVDGETTTAIEGLNATNFGNNCDIFNLNGQRVNKAHKGIYIINGKKAVVK